MIFRHTKWLIIIMLSYIIFITSTFADDNRKIDSINLVLKSHIDDSARSVLEFELYEILRKKNNEIEARRLAQRIIDSIEQNKVTIKPWEFFYIGRYYTANQKYDKAKEYLLLALEYYKNRNNCYYIAKTYAVLSFISYYQGFYKASIDYSQKQYYIAKECKNIDQEIDAIHSIGFNYLIIGDYERAYEYFTEAYQLSKENSNDKFLVAILDDIGSLKAAISEYSIALKYHFEALELAKKTNNKRKIGHIYGNIGDTYVYMGIIEKALENYLKSTELLKLTEDKSNLVLLYGNLGNCYQQLGEYKNSLKYFNEALQLALSLRVKHIISDVYRKLAGLYHQNNYYDQAYRYLKLYKTYNDSLKIEENIKNLAEIQTKFETERNETQARILSKENEINELNIIRKRYLLTFLLLLSISLIVITIIIIKKNRMRNRQRIVELTQQNLRNQINPHFIFNTLNSIQYYLFKNDKNLSNNYLSKFARLLNLVFDNAMHKSVPINDELNALELYLELEKLRFKEKLDYEIKVDENIDILDYKIPPLILQPFVENSILHGIMPKQEKGKIEIDLRLINELIICSVKDDGIGREKAMEIKMKKETSYKSLGTKISEERIQSLNLLYGKKLKIDYIDLHDENMRSQGTEVLLSFPIIS